MPKLPILIKGKIRYAPCHISPYSPITDRVRMTFNVHLPEGIKGRILDAGCSSGMTTREISYLYPDAHVIGIDVNEKILPQRKDWGVNLEFHLGNFYLLPGIFPPRTFDAIFSMNNFLNVVRDMYRTETEAVLQGFFTRLKINGYLLMSGHKEGVVLMKQDDAFQVLWAGKWLGDEMLFGVLPQILGISTIGAKLPENREQKMRASRRRFGI